MMMQSHKRNLERILRQNWFLLCLVLAILLARPRPEIGEHGGVLRPEWTVKVFAVSLIFFFSGFGLKLEELGRALCQVLSGTFITLVSFRGIK